MKRDEVRDFFASHRFNVGVDWATGESFSARELRSNPSPNQSAARVTTEPKIIVHPPKYGGAIEEKTLAVGNG